MWLRRHKRTLTLWDAPATGLRQFRSAVFDTGEVRLHVVRGPRNGPPLLLLPGLNDPWFGYRDVLAPLSRRFHVHVVDHRGHGDSSRPETGSYKVVDYARDMEVLLREGIGSPAFVAGNSLGALLAAGLAARLPGLVRGCVLEDGPFFITEPARWKKSPLRLGLFEDLAARLEQAQRGGISEASFARAWRQRPWNRAPRGDLPARAIFLGKFLALLAPLWSSLPPNERRRLSAGYAALLAGRTVRWRDTMPDAWSAEAARCAWRIAAACPRAATRADFSAGFDHAAALRAIRCPTLVLEADRDLVGLLPKADIARLMGCLGGTRAVHRLCEGALHAIHQSHPALYAETISGFLLDTSE
jgi:pimeloyl-ACP methyl ester carboxylesterase